MREIKAARVGLYPQLFNLLEIFLPLLVLLERFERQAVFLWIFRAEYIGGCVPAQDNQPGPRSNPMQAALMLS